MKKLITINPQTGKPEISPVEVQEYQRLKRELLEELEDLISSFIRAGNILREIRDRRLYLAEYSTFEEFCLQTMNRGRSYIYKLISSTDVVQGLIESGMTVIDLPKSEAVARMVGRFPKDQRKEIMESANAHAHRAGRDQAMVADIEEAAKQFSPEKIQEILIAGTLINLKQSLRLLPKSIPWTEFDEILKAQMRLILQSILERVVFLMDSEQEKPVGPPQPKAFKN